MKRLLILFVLLTSININSQNLWTSEQNLNFTIQSNTNISSFVDENGIHIIYSKNGGIKYALINSQGSVIKYDKVIEPENSGTAFANVVAINNNVYVLYYKNNDIKVAKSSNQGDNWDNNFDYYPLTGTNCNKMLAYKEENSIHITWCELENQSYYYDVHYVKYIPADMLWTEYKNVTENEEEGGYNPDLTYSSPKVEVNYIHTYYSRPRNREKVSLNNWGNPEDIAFNPHIINTNVRNIKPFIIGDQLNVIYKADYSGMYYYGHFISHSYRNLNSSTWYANPTELQTDIYDQYEMFSHVANSTNDGKIHIIYWDSNERTWIHRSLTGTTFSDIIAQVNISPIETNSLVSISNDLYLLYTNNLSTPGNIKFRHYDNNPLPPGGFEITNSGSPYYHPVLSWTSIKDPDVRINTSGGIRIERRLWNNELQTWTTWTQTVSLSGTSVSFTDNDIYNASGAGQGKAEYRLRCVDYSNHYSDYTPALNIRYGTTPEKTGNQFNNEKPEEFSLFANYPNPFNPNTRIAYTLAEDSKVIIKVYNLLGMEVAELINEFKPAGYYEAEFDASSGSCRIGSGVYVYSLTAIKGSRVLFNKSKQMILIK